MPNTSKSLRDARASYKQRERARLTGMKRRQRLNSWAAGITVVILVGVGAALFLVNKPMFDRTAVGHIDIRQNR